MYEVNIYLEIKDLGLTEDGSPIPAGCKINLGISRVLMDYDELVADLNVNAIADMLHVPHGAVSILTPEEYSEKYGEEGEEP